MKHLGTQKIETERLILRKNELKDAQELFELLSDQEILKYLTGIPKYTGVEMAEDYIGKRLAEKYKRDDCYEWAIVEKTSNKFIGKISVFEQDEERRKANLAWYISPLFRNKGYMTETVKAVVKFLQKVGFERIEAYAHTENLASQRVMEKCGFIYEGTLRKYDYERNGDLYDVKMYSIVL